jgi:hypothetical protein
MHDAESLALEKLNAERITGLEHRVDRRLEGLEKKIDNIITYFSKKTGNGFDWKGIAVVITLIFAVGGMLQQQVSFLWSMSNKGYEEMGKQLDTHSITSMRETKLLFDKEHEIIKDIQKEIFRIRDWKDQVESDHTNAAQWERIYAIEKQLETKTTDRFYGTEGRALERRIENVEYMCKKERSV